MRNTFLLAIAAALLIAAPAGPVGAAEIRVLGGGAVQEVVTNLAQAFEKKTGHKVVGTFASMGLVRDKLKAGEKAEIVFMTGVAMDGAVTDGAKLAGERKAVGRTMVGLAVKEGAEAPDIKTVESFKRALLAARSVAYVDPASGATSGTHFAKVLEQLGISEQIKPKTKLRLGRNVVELVVTGEAELGIQQISDILPVKGAKLVGPLPAAVNLVSTYLGSLTADASPEAKAFLDFVTGAEAKSIIEQAGLAPGAG